MLQSQFLQPGVQSVIPQAGMQLSGVQGLAPGGVSVLPGVQSVGVPSVLPSDQGLLLQGAVPGGVSVVQGALPGVQSVGVPGVYPGVQSVGVPGAIPGVLPVQSVTGALPVQSVGVPGAIPGALPGTLPVQSVGVTGALPVQSVGVPGALPGVMPSVQITPYIQPIGSRHPIEQNHIGSTLLTPAGFSNIGGSPYGKVSQIVGLTPAVGAGLGTVSALPGVAGVSAVPGVAGVGGIAGVDPSAYLQHVEILRNACQGAGTDEDAIVNVIANTTNTERAIIRRLYTQKYNEDLVSRLQSELSGDFKEAAVGSFMTPTEYDAYCLNGAMKGLGTKEGVLSEIIGSRTPQELLAIKQTYAANYGETLDNAIAGDTSGDYQKLLLQLLQCQRSNNPQPDMNACMNDAAALYQAGEGKWGTDEATFYRVFANRSPAELAAINQYYKQNSNKGLLGAINSDFSGDTKDLLDTIVRSNVDPYGYYAGRIHESVAGLGTNDSRLIRNICARHAVDLPLIKQAYARDYGTDMLADVQGDTSGHYRQVLSSLISNAR